MQAGHLSTKASEGSAASHLLRRKSFDSTEVEERKKQILHSLSKNTTSTEKKPQARVTVGGEKTSSRILGSFFTTTPSMLSLTGVTKIERL